MPQANLPIRWNVIKLKNNDIRTLYYIGVKYCTKLVFTHSYATDWHIETISSILTEDHVHN